jgi:hypothetical protein
VNAGAPPVKQLPGVFQGARHKGLLSFVENVDHCVVLLVFENECSVRSLRDGRLLGRVSPWKSSKPASMPETVSCLTRRVCFSGFERVELEQAFLRRS